QMFRFEAGKWQPIEDTGGKRDFDDWIGDNIGLTYDTFTSSVLMLQGKAEKLLDSRPEGRREALPGIGDLGRFEQLHKKAADRRREMESQLKTLTHQLSVLPAVAPLELEAAKNQITESLLRREQARAEVERLLALELKANEWQGLQQRLV